jgi:amino acid transporter
MLHGLAKEGAAPRHFLYTTKNGVPIVALVLGFNLVGFLPLLKLSSGAGPIYTWINLMTGVSTFITCKS